MISGLTFAVLAPMASASTVSVINAHHDITEHRSGGLIERGYTTNLFKHQPRGWEAAIAAGDTIIVEQRGVDGSNTADVQAFLNAGGRIILLGDDSDITNDFYNDIFGTSISFEAPTGPTTWAQTDAVVGTEFEDDVGALRFADSVYATTDELAAGSSVYYAGDTGAQVFSSTFGLGELTYIGWDFCCGATPDVYAEYYEVLESAIGASRNVAPVPLPAGLPLMLLGLGGVGLVARRKRMGA
jgi:hypothetical protein